LIFKLDPKLKASKIRQIKAGRVLVVLIKSIQLIQETKTKCSQKKVLRLKQTKIKHNKEGNLAQRDLE